MDYLMAPLDFTEVTSGILLDKGFPMMEIAAAAEEMLAKKLQKLNKLSAG
ncbi:MAG: hypothetical protein WBG42_01325 [Cryomorphaceae bacterium]